MGLTLKNLFDFFEAGRGNLKWPWLVFPFLLWTFLFRDFFTGQAPFINDTYAIYSATKFYLENMKTGVFPFWNPYWACGMPYIRQVGEYNPLFFLILLFNQMGMGFAQAFTAFMALYFFTGLIGFYLFLRTILKNDVLGYVGYLLLSFSSVGMTMFVQLTMVLIFVPVVWFFYFFVRFIESGKKSFFIGLVFCLGIIFTTYIPFYFFTIFILFSLLALVIFPERTIPVAGCFFYFFRKNPLVAALSVIFLGVVVISPITTWLTIKQDLIPLARQKNVTMDNLTASPNANLDFAEVSGSGLGREVLYGNLFSRLDKIKFSAFNDRIFYLPIFTFLVFFSAIGAPFNRRILLATVFVTILFMICLTQWTPLSRFLYDHVFFLKWFRNYFFFLPFLVSVCIILALELLSALLKQIETPTGEKKVAAWSVLAAHVGLFIFLCGQKDIIAANYITILGSLLFFVLYFLGKIKVNSAGAKVFLTFLIILQPWSVLSAYNDKARSSERSKDALAEHFEIVREGLNVPNKKPIFFYTRPHELSIPPGGEVYTNFLFFLSMRDTPAMILPGSGFPTTRTYLLLKHVSPPVLSEYVENKFILYGQVKRFSGPMAEELNAVSELFRTKARIALIASQDKNSRGEEGSPEDVNFITGNSDEFKIVHFDVNRLTIETNLIKEKFLVYNDSYHRGWQAKVNGNKTELYRANFAFKGLWVPSGKARVELAYVPAGGRGLYYFILFCFFAAFAYLIYEGVRECRFGLTKQ